MDRPRPCSPARPPNAWRAVAATALVALAACGGPPAGASRPAATARPAGAPRSGALPFVADDLEGALARGRREGRPVLVHGAAEWCHFCHVMENETYRDPEVRAFLAARVVAVKVDVDARPDVAERFQEWGWPATVILGPDGEVRAAFQGYLPRERFLALVAGALAQPSSAPERPAAPPLPDADARAFAEAQLDATWDDAEGGWGARQKAPMGGDNAWSLALASAGDARGRARALVALDRQAALLDPVWGGIYQYSAASDWKSPHFEKLLAFQAFALENYAEAHALTGAPRHRARALAVHAYLERFLREPGGGFYATQDADLGAHGDVPFLAGAAYFAKDDAARTALGTPRVDRHVYARETGLGAAAYVAAAGALARPELVHEAERAIARILATHARPDGLLAHDAATGDPARHLADQAAVSLALVRLARAAGDGAHLARARALLDRTLLVLHDDVTGGLFATTEDPRAFGAFARRRLAFDEGVLAARALAALARETGETRYARAALGALRALSTRPALEAQGRVLGEYLLAWRELDAALR